MLLTKVARRMYVEPIKTTYCKEVYQVKEIMHKLDRLASNRPIELVERKSEGKKIIEYYGDFVPEQWIVAAGAEPYLIMKGGDPQSPEATLDYSIRFMNPLAASMVGNYLRGVDRVMPMADGVVIQQHDWHYGRMSEILEFKGLPVYKVGVPADNMVGISREYYRHELREFRDYLEKLVGHPLDENAVRECYEKTNKINELMHKISELRKKDNPPITFSDFIKLNHYTMRVDYDTSIEALTQIYEELKDAPGVHKDGAPRILIMGRAVAEGDYVVPGLIEGAGGCIACDFLDEAIRPYNMVIPTEGDIVDAYAKSIIDDRVPQCIFQPSWETRFEHLKELVKEFNIDGILWYQLAFDEIYDMEYTCYAKWLQGSNLPIMKLETSYEYSREATAPLATRIESFVDSLKEGKK